MGHVEPNFDTHHLKEEDRSW